MKLNKLYIPLSLGILCLLSSCCKKVTESTTESNYHSSTSFKQLKDTVITVKPIQNITIIPKYYRDTIYVDVKDDSTATTITTVTKKDGNVTVKNDVRPKPIIITKIKEVEKVRDSIVYKKVITKPVTVTKKPWYFYPTLVLALLIGALIERFTNVTKLLSKLITGII